MAQGSSGGRDHDTRSVESLCGRRAQGAPEAIQVADRFHLLQNVAEALEQVCSAHGQAITAVNEVMRQAPIRQSDGSMAVPVPPPPPAPTAQELATQRRARRLATYEAAEEIVRVARTQGADLIIMGTHDRRGLRRWFRRSVTDQVRRQAPAAVLTVGPHRRCLEGEGDLDALFSALGLGQTA